MWFWDYKEGFLKMQNISWYSLTKSVVNVFYCLPLSASASLVEQNRHFTLEFPVHLMKSSVILQNCFQPPVYWRSSVFWKEEIFPTVTGSQSQVYLMQPLFSAVKYRSGAVLIASGKAADTRGWQFIICLSGTSICLQPWERWACLID